MTQHLYACPSCGVVQTEDEEPCPVCTYTRFETIEIGGDDAEEFVCEECGESFTSQQGLSAHSRVHDDE